MSSGLPPQDSSGKNYTESDLQHIVAREIAKQQIQQLQNGQIELNKQLVEMTTSFWGELKAIRQLMEKHPGELKECKLELRSEIDKDFASRIELLQIEGRIENQISAVDIKVDKQWIKITVTISVVSACITAVGVAMNYWLVLQRISGS